MAKIAVITANIGGIDDVKPIPKQTVEFDYYCFTEENLPYPLSVFDNRMKAKYCKLQAHVILPPIYDFIIWIDGRSEVVASDFVESMCDKACRYNIVVTKHAERKTLKEEFDFILDLMDGGNGYLLSRYNRREIEMQRSRFPGDFELYACGVFAWNVANGMTSFFNDWWEKSLIYGPYDQAIFSFLVNMRLVTVGTIDYSKIKINKHK